MASKKKFLGFFVCLLLLLFGPLYENTCRAESATDYFNFTSGDLLTIYDIFKGNSITYRKQDSNYNNIVSLWESGEEMLTSKNSSDLDNIADNLNQFMFEKWILSGDGVGANSTSMNDKNIFIQVQPASTVSTSTRQVRFAFIPRDNVQVYLNETGTYNNDPSFTVQPTIYNLSGDGSMTKETYGTSHTIYLYFNAAGDPTFHFRSSSSDLTAFNNGYLFYTRNQETPYINTYVYDLGLLSTFRQNSNLSINQVYFKKYNNQQYLLSRLGFRYDLSSETLESGEIVQPTPTPQPTSSGGNVDLSETNNLISGVISSLTDPISSGDIEGINSSNIDNITSDYDINDPHESIWGVIIDGFHHALTDTNPYFSVSFFDKTYVLEPINPAYPEAFDIFLPKLMIYVVIIGSLKFWRDIIHKLQSGGALEVAHMFSGFDWSKYF